MWGGDGFDKAMLKRPIMSCSLVKVLTAVGGSGSVSALLAEGGGDDAPMLPTMEETVTPAPFGEPK